jgi:clan AA aspartic protease
MGSKSSADCSVNTTSHSLRFRQGTPPMGLVYADFTLANLFTKKSVPIRALVDTGAMEVYVTAPVARELGFDVEEVSLKRVILADGSVRHVPTIAPVRTHFGDRSCLVDVVVLGDECLVGVVPLELMALIVDPVRQRVVFDPKYPAGPCHRV